MSDKFDAQTVTAWLGYVYEHAINEHLSGVINIAAPTANGTGPKWKSRCFALTQIDDAGAKAVAGSDAELNTYYRVHLLDKPVEHWERGKGEQTRWITHITADVDVDGPGHKPPDGKKLPNDNEAIELIDATLPPSAIIASGGGYYPVWRLSEPFETSTPANRERYKNIGRRLDAALGAHGYHVDATALDLARVIRPPGVVNQKPGRDPRPVVVLRGWCDGAGDYTIDQIETQLPELAPKTVKPKSIHGPSNGRPPWEIFASRYDVEDVLANDPSREWEDVGLRGGMRAWRYVGSSSDYSLKQSDTGAIIIWSSTIADVVGIEPGDAVDLWGLACRLAGIDPTEAAKGYKP